MAPPPSRLGTLRVVTIVSILGLIIGWFVLRTPPSDPPRPAPSHDASSAADARAEAPAAPTLLPRTPATIGLLSATATPDVSVANGLFEGRVVSRASGRGCAGATLTFARDHATRSVTADATGAFRFVPDAVGTWGLLAVTAPGHLTVGGEGRGAVLAYEASAGVAVRGVVVPLAEAVTYQGVVLSPEGSPVVGASIRALDGSGTWTSGPDGSFAFSAADDTMLQARHASWAPGFARLDLTAQAARRVTLRLRPAGTATELDLTGVVTSAEGLPVDGALVAAVARGGGRDEPPLWRTVTGTDGRFAFETVPAGSYLVRATDASHEPAVAEEATAGTPIRLMMRPGRTLQGTVTDGRTGRPAASFTVVVARVEGIENIGAPTVLPVVDGSGHFAVHNLGDGTHRVRAVAAGRSPSDEVTVRVANENSPVTLTLPAGAVISGMVRDRTTSQPIADARVSLEGRYTVTDLPVDLLARTTTDARGHFELQGIPRGPRAVVVAAPGYHGRILSGITVEEGRAVEGLVVDLAAVEDGGVAALELVGIGVMLSARAEVMVIGRVMPGGGAAEAGLHDGDEVHSVDGTPVGTLGFEGTVQRIRGPEGSTVRLQVRSGGGELREVVVTRRRIRT
jgi:hypothetical protein